MSENSKLPVSYRYYEIAMLILRSVEMSGGRGVVTTDDVQDAYKNKIKAHDVNHALHLIAFKQWAVVENIPDIQYREHDAYRCGITLTEAGRQEFSPSSQG